MRQYTTVTARKRYIMRLLVRATKHKLRGDQSGMMTVIAEGFVGLGGVYIKFLQGVLLQLPAMRLWKSQNKFDVYENVSTTTINVNKLLALSLPSASLNTIRSIDPLPFAAGSFGQAYRAVLCRGDQVVLKILRPGAQKNLKEDLRLIKFASRLLGGVLKTVEMDLNTLTKDFVASTACEVNYVAEAEFAIQMYDHYKNSKTIVIPKTYPELCGKTVITQEYIDGVSPAQLLRSTTQGVNKENYADMVHKVCGSNIQIQLTNLGLEMYIGALSGRAIHGDPHPGNIRLLPGNKVGLLDFGIKAQLVAPPRAYYLMLREWWRSEYLRKPDPGAIFLSYVRFYSEKLYISMSVVSEYLQKQENKPINLSNYLVQLINDAYHKKVSEQMVQQDLDRIIRGNSGGTKIGVLAMVNPNNRFKVMSNIKDGSILRAAVTYDSMITELGYRYIIPDVYNKLMGYVEKSMPELTQDQPNKMKIDQAAQVIYNWLDSIATKDIELYRLISSYLKTDLSKTKKQN